MFQTYNSKYLISYEYCNYCALDDIDEKAKLTQPNLQQELNAIAQTEMAMSYKFQMKERGCGETNQLSYYCCNPLDIVAETLDGNHDTKQHHPLHSAYSPHQQTSDWPSYMQQTAIGNFSLSRGDLLEEVQGNEKEAIGCCYNSHCNIDVQSLHQGILVCISVIMKSKTA